MKRSFLFFLIVIITCCLAAGSVLGQFPIKIPKITKPTTQPAPSGDTGSGTSTPSAPTAAATRGGGGPYVVRPEPPANPQFLPESLEIQVERWDYHHKVPNDNHNSSWAPRIRYDVYWGGSSKLRYKAEYYMPDGTLWFSEPIEHRGSPSASTGLLAMFSQDDSDRDKKAIVTGGLFGIKIINTKDDSTAFQGKFKVVRYKPKYSDERYKNDVDYYVDYDWKLPIGFADLYFENDVAEPTIRMWFKGDLKVDSFEARLFHNGQQIASTDDAMGGVGTGERYYAYKRGDDMSLFWSEFKFSWPKRAVFIRTPDLRNFTAYQDAKFINQMPGEYVVKVYYNGDQVRETSFSIGNNGTYSDNGIATKSNLTTNKVILPVKVMGTLDKWNPANAKSMGFFGNPVSGM